MPATAESPTKPIILEPVKDLRALVPGLCIYELSYKKQLMTRTHFQAHDKQEAIEMGKTFCEAIHARFCGVDDFMVDLVEYAKHLNRGDSQ